MKNIFITDLDHTFLRNDLSVSDYTKNIWNSYASSSVLGIATARTYMKTTEFLGGVELNAPMILLDGALIATKEKKSIDTKLISKDIGDMIIEEGWKFSIYPFILSLSDEKNLTEVSLHDEVLNSDQKTVLSRYSSADKLQKHSGVRAMDSNFKIVYMGEESLLRELYEHLVHVFGSSLKFIFAPEAYVGCYFLTILHPEADKSHGIQSVQEYLDFDLKNLTVFGDNLNDIGMFHLANTSVAMSNAQDEVKAKANVILEYSNDQDGVAKYLEGLRNG